MVPLLQLAVILSLTSRLTVGQFPAICNTPENLETKTCCPDNCGGEAKGKCESVVEPAMIQSENANATIVNILRDAPNIQGKGTADARFLWPTVVFENICICEENYWGVSCGECNFGWTGSDCNTRKTPVVRKSFARLTKEEKQTFIDATKELKQEMGFWSVVVGEPANYSSGNVILQDVSTYNFFIYLHDYVARDEYCEIGGDIDFAHAGPVFPVWHRRYILTVEREFQRITGNESFGFPYWQWEQNDKSMFTEEYYGVPSNLIGPAINVMGDIINPEDWHTICDITYQIDATCAEAWRPCNPAADLANRNPLQRGGISPYLPNVVEVIIALAAPSYDAPDVNGQYSRDDPRTSFRSRLEGWNGICSAAVCIYTETPRAVFSARVHNEVHVWMGGQMDDVPAAVNDPMFNLHHCNVDRILESWMQRFAGRETSQNLLPAYVPVSDSHPGHNRDDFMVPFFPLITPGEQYRVSEEWGYVYDELIPALLRDDEIPNCEDIGIPDTCPICDADGACINCTTEQCPPPNTIPEFLSPESLSPGSDDEDTTAIELGLGLGLGLPLLIAIIIITFLVILILCNKKSKLGSAGDGIEMTTKS